MTAHLAEPDHTGSAAFSSYTAADYRAAAAATPLAPPLTGATATAAWAPDLRPALTELGVRIEEETVLDDLPADLTP